MEINKEIMIGELLTKDFFDLISGNPIKTLESQIYFLTNDEWDKFINLINKHRYIRVNEQDDTIIINNLILKKQN